MVTRAEMKDLRLGVRRTPRCKVTRTHQSSHILIATKWSCPDLVMENLAY